MERSEQNRLIKETNDPFTPVKRLQRSPIRISQCSQEEATENNKVSGNYGKTEENVTERTLSQNTDNKINLRDTHGEENITYNNSGNTDSEIKQNKRRAINSSHAQPSGTSRLPKQIEEETCDVEESSQEEDLESLDMEEDMPQGLRTLFELERIVGILTRNRRPITDAQIKSCKELSKKLTENYLQLHNSYMKLKGKYEERINACKTLKWQTDELRKDVIEDLKEVKHTIMSNAGIKEKELVHNLPFSYAAVAASAPNGPRKIHQNPNRSMDRKTVLIYPENDKTTSEEVRDALYKNVNPQCLKIHRLSKIRHGGIAVELEGKGKIDGVMDLLKKVGNVREPKKRLPKMIIYDIHHRYQPEELAEDIYQQNFAEKGISSEELALEFKPLFRTGPKDK